MVFAAFSEEMSGYRKPSDILSGRRGEAVHTLVMLSLVQAPSSQTGTERLASHLEESDQKGKEFVFHLLQTSNV